MKELNNSFLGSKDINLATLARALSFWLVFLQSIVLSFVSIFVFYLLGRKSLKQLRTIKKGFLTI